ncbi:DUF1153 domain-containing protein [Devosia nitrariae]|uniref:DUF1153 domain-containing protein n=1 Tax=Devosia nitrariae TaxID=2071872 RepID=A0ABQ5W7R1_9HYPH|nr:DUF1153 domain-containing protein [Devosia nitrariae]GLQ55849.1 hypothetical protein GCM10010862_31080 [Devosia nitrariae]
MLHRLEFAIDPEPAVDGKAEVVAAVRGGLLSLEEARDRYTLSVDEFLNWRAAIDKHGLAGLRATWIQHYRET